MTTHNARAGHDSAATAQHGSRTRLGIAGLSLAMLLPSLDTSIANVALPTLSEVFAAPFAQVQWVVLAYLLTVTAFLVSAGRLGDLVGRRRMLAWGLWSFTAASAACAAAPSLGALIAARAVQGLGGAMMIAQTVALVGTAAPVGRTGSAMGLLGTMSAVGTALGPSLGGALIASLGWPALFWINIPLGGLALTLIARGLPPEQPAQRRLSGSDPTGTLLLAAALTAYTLALTEGRSAFGPLAVTLAAAATVLMALFVWVETHTRAPLVEFVMFRDAMLTTGLGLSLLVATVIMATLVVGPFYLTHALGLEPALVGATMSVGPLVAATAATPAGRLVDRIGSQSTTVAGLLAMLCGTALLAMIPAAAGAPGYATSVAAVTAGYALFQAANNTSVMARARAEQRGVVSGMLNLSRNLGLITGVAVMGAVFSAAVGSADVASSAPAAVAAGMHTTFAGAAAIIGVAVAIAMGRGRWRQRLPAAKATS